jgi:hypothetical protein
MRSDRRQAFEEAEAEGSGLGDGAWSAPRSEAHWRATLPPRVLLGRFEPRQH